MTCQYREPSGTAEVAMVGIATITCFIMWMITVSYFNERFNRIDAAVGLEPYSKRAENENR